MRIVVEPQSPYPGRAAMTRASAWRSKRALQSIQEKPDFGGTEFWDLDHARSGHHASWAVLMEHLEADDMRRRPTAGRTTPALGPRQSADIQVAVERRDDARTGDRFAGSRSKSFFFSRYLRCDGIRIRPGHGAGGPGARRLGLRSARPQAPTQRASLGHRESQIAEIGFRGWTAGSAGTP